MSNRVSNDQLDTLLDFLAEHPLVARGVGLGSRSKAAVEQQWNDLAHRLNAFGSGSAKSGERWKKYWADLKHKSKTRIAKRRREASGTGGGPGSRDDLTEVDKKVLAIIGEQAVFGDIEHRVPLTYSEVDTQEPDGVIVSQEVEIPNGTEYIETEPSRSTVLQNIEDVDFSIVSQPLPPTETQQPPRSEALSPVSRPTADHRRDRRPPRSDRTDITRNSSRITPEWLNDIENRRVEAETKLANAAMVMAESARLQAESMHVLVELVRRQSDDIRALLELTNAYQNNQSQ